MELFVPLIRRFPTHKHLRAWVRKYMTEARTKAVVDSSVVYVVFYEAAPRIFLQVGEFNGFLILTAIFIFIEGD